jgi:hypothetical protein
MDTSGCDVTQIWIGEEATNQTGQTPGHSPDTSGEHHARLAERRVFEPA